MDEIRAFYAGKEGLHPEKVGEIRIREEDVEELVGQEGAGAGELDRLAGNLPEVRGKAPGSEVHCHPLRRWQTLILSPRRAPARRPP